MEAAGIEPATAYKTTSYVNSSDAVTLGHSRTHPATPPRVVTDQPPQNRTDLDQDPTGSGRSRCEAYVKTEGVGHSKTYGNSLYRKSLCDSELVEAAGIEPGANPLSKMFAHRQLCRSC